MNKIKNSLQQIQLDILELKKALSSVPNWISITDISKEVGLTPQSVRKKLLSGQFEPEVDFKYIGSKMYVARNAISRIKRIRK